MAVEPAHRGTGLRVVIHGDEREPARFASHPVRHKADFIDLAMLFEQILKIVLCALKREITYVQFHGALKRKNYRATEPFPGIGFQTTNEQYSPDDLPSSEVKQRNPI